MTSLWEQSWFWWTLALLVVLPILLIGLTELHNALQRRHSPLSAPVAMLRNFALPAGALFVLFTRVWEIDREETWIQILATVFGFLVLVLVLSALNVVLFKQAGAGTWRERMPSIFIDIARLLLVVIGLAMLFSWVWGADVGGFFAALGVTSIVLGFALQNAVGSIISGLLLLFEQPFQLGDWLEAEGVRGRIVEVNWRSVHIETGDGVQIIPNATLAGASFSNLSQPAGRHSVTIATAFGAADPPDQVLTALERTAFDVPVSGVEANVDAVMTGPGAFATTIAIRSPADAATTAATFTRWLWYAPRRAGLHLNGADPAWSTPDDVLAALREIGPARYFEEDELTGIAASMRLERWAAGELLQREGVVPDGLRFIRRGRVAMRGSVPGHGVIQYDEYVPGDVIGITTLTKERVTPTSIAIDEVETLLVPQAAIEDLVRQTPALARDLGRELDLRRDHYRQLLTTTLTPTNGHSNEALT